MPSVRNLTTILFALLSVVSASPLPPHARRDYVPHARRDFIELGGKQGEAAAAGAGASSTSSVARASATETSSRAGKGSSAATGKGAGVATATETATATATGRGNSGSNQNAGAGDFGGFIPLGLVSGSSSAADSGATSAGSSGSGKNGGGGSGNDNTGNGGGAGGNNSTGNGGSGKNDNNDGNGGGSDSQTVTKVTTTKKVTKLANGDIQEQDCVIKITEKVQGQASQFLRQGAFTCTNQAESLGVVDGSSDGTLLCFRVGYVDRNNSQFGGELTVWNVGSSQKDLSQAQIEMTFSDGTTVATPAGVLAASANTTDVGSIKGSPVTQIGSFHFNHAILAGGSATNLAAFAPQSVNMAVGDGNVTILGLLDVSDAAGLPTDETLATTRWGLFDQTTKNVQLKLSRRDERQGGDNNSKNGDSKDGNSGKGNGNNNSNSGRGTVIVEDKQCETRIISGSNSGFTISNGIVIPDTTTTISRGIVITDNGSGSTTSSASKSKNTNSGKGGNSNDSSSSSSEDSTTITTTSSADSSSQTRSSGSNNANAGINVSIQGFGGNVGADEVSSVLSAASLASANAANAVGGALATGTPSVTNTAANGAVAANGIPAGTQAADTAPSASSTPFQMPGRQLQVLPIGLGVFAGVSVITLIIVGVVTYERRKYRRQFRERRMQEQISTAAGFGTFDGRMREAVV